MIYLHHGYCDETAITAGKDYVMIGKLQSKESIALPDHKQLVNGTSMASKLYFARHEWLSSGKENS